jgi:hypothetical protein
MKLHLIHHPLFFSFLLVILMFSCELENEDKKDTGGEKKEITVFGYVSTSILLEADSNSSRYQFSSLKFDDTVHVKAQDPNRKKYNLIFASGINLIDIALNDTFRVEKNTVTYKGIVTDQGFFMQQIQLRKDTVVIAEFSSEPILKTSISDTVSINPLPAELYAGQLVHVTGRNLNEHLKLFVNGNEMSYTLIDSKGLEFTLPEGSDFGLYKIEFFVDENLILSTLQLNKTHENLKYTGVFRLYGYLISNDEPGFPNIGNESRTFTSTKQSDTLFIEMDPTDHQKLRIKTRDLNLSVVPNDSFYVEGNDAGYWTRTSGIIQETGSYLKIRRDYRNQMTVLQYTTDPLGFPYAEVSGARVGNFAINLYAGKKIDVPGDNLPPDLDASINGITLKKEYLADSLMSFECPDLPVNKIYNLEFKLFGLVLLKKQVILTDQTPVDTHLKRLPVSTVLKFITFPDYIINFSPGGTPLVYFNRSLYEFSPSDHSIIHRSVYDLDLHTYFISSFELGGLSYILNHQNARFKRYDLNADQWTNLNNLPLLYKSYSKSFVNSSFVIGDKAYVIADYLWEYTPETDSWKQLSQIPDAGEFTKNFGFCFSLNGMGYFGNVVTSIFYRYDPSADSWERMPDFNFTNSARPYVFAPEPPLSIVLEDKVYVFFGKKNEVLSFDGTNWAKAFDFYGFNRQVMVLFKQDNRLYFGQGNSNVNAEYFFYDDFWEFTP